MGRRGINIVIMLALFSLTGVVVTQIYWVSQAFNVQEKQFNDRVVIAMTSVVEKIQTIKADQGFVEPVTQESSNFFVANINDTLHPYLLEALLKEEFLQSNIEVNFEYGIYDCFNDSIVFGSKVNFNKLDNEVKQEATSLVKRFNKDGHYFGVIFPSKSRVLFGQMKFWGLLSGLILLVVISFTYAIFIMLKQRRLSEVKNDFINNMTHELKTPISTIDLSSDVLMQEGIGAQPERLQQYARIIKSENNRLKLQVDKVLQIATLSPEKMNLKKQDVDLHKVIQNAKETLEVGLEKPGGKITLKLDATKYIVEGDMVHLTNIVYNLLDNAIKYAQSEPEVSISTETQDNILIVRVKDNGIGISKTYHKAIFDKFYRVPTGNRHDVKGFGLGLFYVMTVVKAHGGSIDLNSELGKGSEFILQLKLKTA